MPPKPGVVLSWWGTWGTREQLGFAVGGDEGWIHLGNVAFSVTVMASSYGIGGFER